MESRATSSCALHRHGNPRSGKPRVTKPMHSNNTPGSKSHSFDGHDSWWSQVNKINSGPRRSLKMTRIMETPSKKKWSRHKYETRTSRYDLGLTTLDSQQGSHQVGHGRFE